MLKTRMQNGRRILLLLLAIGGALVLLTALVFVLGVAAGGWSVGEKPLSVQPAQATPAKTTDTNASTAYLAILTPRQTGELYLTSLKNNDWATADALRRPDSYVKAADETRLQEEERIKRDQAITSIEFKSEIVNATNASISFWVKRPGFKGQSSDRQLLEQGQPDERQLVTVELVRFDSGWKWQRVNWGPMYTGRAK